MTKKVMYIEDNADNQRLVQKVLRAKGYDIILAEDGITGYEMIKQYQPAVLLLDISLPGELDGLDVAAKIKNNLNIDQPWIIAVTASAMIGDREHFLNNGCDDYISKPISIQALLAKIEQVFSGHI